MDEDECKESGFIKKSLKCSSCNSLLKYGLDEILTDCQKCCSEDKKLDHERYPYAELRYCECNINRFPQIAAFIKGETWRFEGKLTVRHVRGTLPTIVLKKLSGVDEKSLNIQSWDTDTIIEFLNDWLIN